MIDPTLNRINQMFQFLYSKVQSGGSLGSGSWGSYGPSVNGSGGMSAAGSAFRADFNQGGDGLTTILLNINVVLSGVAANTIIISLPVKPISTTLGNAFACVMYSGTDVFNGTANIVGGSIQVTRFDGSDFTLGSVQVIISGAYRTS
jgi:hypothetical protein